ncbi:MAG: 16S rRNA (adenine(1518)-N(6)/adenine(1519)-N(6))-dimethyltransferase RsmA [Candidatus Cloacimonas sp.]|nr:16S rRNA (adenine(1518)-N(6)/adenine(1519)-N(6))-dimethyltransferase RsmA [Candidatus Cloacimonadota bacterium]
MFRAKKAFGQNFLLDHNIADKIVNSAELSKGDFVWEIGSGKGILTERIIKTGAELTCFEIDRELCQYLKNTFGEEIKLIEGDVLESDWSALYRVYNTSRKITLIANIPYNITSPILYKLAEHHDIFDRIILMIQKEVEEKLSSKPGAKNYGFLTLKTRFYFDLLKLMKVPAHLFSPRPKVDSVVISLEPRKDFIKLENEKLYWQIITATFQTRRKTLRNSLSLIANREEITALDRMISANSSLNFSLNSRGETLDEEDFITLYNLISGLRNS